jgi:hypothetical protein
MKLTEEYELPVLPKQTSKNMNKAGRKLTPFKSKVIRLKENNKTDKNVMDSVYGCHGGCLGCYAEMSPGTQWHAIKFDHPVSQILVPALLQGDTLLHLTRCASKKLANATPKEWVRNGVMGDPSYDWELTTRCAETVSMMGTRMVIITKLWKMPSDEQLARLALSGAIFHWSVIAGYDWTKEFDPNTRVPSIVALLDLYDKMTPQESVFIRLCTFAWMKDQPIEEGMGAILWSGQEAFYDLSVKHGFRIIETPWRFPGTDPRISHMDPDELSHPKSYRAKKYGITNDDGSTVVVRSKKWGGPRYFDDNNALTEREAHVIGCVTDCGPCPNQCGSVSDAAIDASIQALL